jgi:hypothetical protein
LRSASWRSHSASFVGVPPEPHGFADPAGRAALELGLAEERRPRGEDARRVHAELEHVDEGDLVGAVAQLGLQGPDAGSGDGDEHRVASLEAGRQEGDGARQEVVGAVIEEGFVLERVDRAPPVGCVVHPVIRHLRRPCVQVRWRRPTQGC